MSNFKNNSKYPIEPSSDEPFVPYFLRSSRATEPIGGRDYVIFPDSFPNIGMPLTGEEMLMVQGKLPEPEILTPNQIKEYFSGSVVQDSQGFVTGDQVYKELLKYVPITRKVNGHALDKDIWLDKADVGLGNVDNTSDLDKPISTATQEALDNLESKHDGEIARLDAKDVDLQNQINDLETSGEEIGQELTNHMKDPNAHPEIVDQTMSDTSTKAISNRIVKAYIDTIIGRQGSKTSVVANDEILVMGADGKYYRATIQKAVLDLVDSAIGDMGKVLHFVGEAGNSAGIPDINSQKDGAVFYVSKLATPTTTITDAVTGQNFTSCDVVMKDGTQWRVIGKTMWWVNLAYSYSEPNKKATITNTAGTGFEIPLASDTVTGLYPKEHFYDVSRASSTPAAGIIPKYTSESKLKSGASATSDGEVLIYEQIQQILDLARVGVNYSILDMSNPIKAIYNSGSTGTGRPITPFWDYSVGLTECCGGDNNSIILKQNSEMVGTTNSVVGTVILTGSLVDRIKLTNKLYCSMDFDTLVNEQASVKITIKNGKSGTTLGAISLLTGDLVGVYNGYVELDTTSLDPSTNNFLTIEMVFTPTSKMADIEVPDGEGEAVVTKPADWSTNKVDRVCISVDPIDDTTLDVITQSELSRIQPILTHIANANVHVTKQDKDTWDAKATEDFVLQKIQDLIGDAPDVLDTLEELAEALKNNPDIIDNILNDLTDIRTKYLPLTGGADHTLTGTTYVAANWILAQGNYYVIQTTAALNRFGSDEKDTTIVTKSGVDIQHLKGDTSYKIWDASNLPTPASTTDLANYIPIAGGRNIGPLWLKDGGANLTTGGIYNASGNALLAFNGSENYISTSLGTTYIRSAANDLIHRRNSVNYKIWDAYNLPNPVQTSDLTKYYKEGDSPMFGESVSALCTRTGGWSYGFYFRHTKAATGSRDVIGTLGIFGNGEVPNYLFFGTEGNEYNSENNLRVYPDKVQWGSKIIYHSGNLPAYPTWATLQGKPTFATVATSGDYNDLNNKPTIPSIPGSLPNPYALTFTGYQSKTYNGSAAVSVAIPSKVSELTRDVDFAIRANNNNLIFNGNEFNFANKTQTSIAINYRNGLGTQDGAAITSYSFYNGTGGTLAGIIAGLIQARSGLQIGTTADFGWYQYSGGGGRIAAGMNTAKGINVRDLLVSDSWGDYTLVPSLGIYSKGNINIQNGKTINFRGNDFSSYGGGIGYDSQGNECVAIWAKQAVTRLRWHAGLDLTNGVTANSMMGRTPDFEVSKVSGVAMGYLNGQIIQTTPSTRFANYSNPTTAGGEWITVCEFSYNQTFMIEMSSNYNSLSPSPMILMVSGKYGGSGQPSITKFGTTGTLFTKARIRIGNTSETRNCFLDIYVNSTYTNDMSFRVYSLSSSDPSNTVDGIILKTSLTRPGSEPVVTSEELDLTVLGVASLGGYYNNARVSVVYDNDPRMTNARTPLAHTHTKSQITDFPTSMPASDVYSWAKQQNKPAYTATEVGAVPTSRTVNGKALSANISLTYSDVGAAQASHTHTKAQITDFPSSMPASDVYSWAKAATKPTYTASEISGVAREDANNDFIVGENQFNFIPDVGILNGSGSAGTILNINFSGKTKAVTNPISYYRFLKGDRSNNLASIYANKFIGDLNGKADNSTKWGGYALNIVTTLPTTGTAGNIYFEVG